MLAGVVLALAALAGGCETTGNRQVDPRPLWPPVTVPSEAQAPSAEPDIDQAAAEAERDGLPEAARYYGSDIFVQPGLGAAEITEDGDVILNFENIELREFVRNVLGDILKVNYVFDARIEGTVTLQTTRPVTREAVLALVETVLRQNGAALLDDGAAYRVVPAIEAIGGQTMPDLASGAEIRAGFGILVLPLEFVSVVQMAQIIEPFLPPEAIMRADVDRNLLVLAGTSRELANLREMARIFDVDWLQGLSAGLFPLDNVAAETAAEELEAVFGDLAEGPLAGLVRIVPIERLNALLVVTQRAQYLDEAEAWIERLDRGTASGQRLFVYYVQNGKAADLAGVLGELFGAEAKEVSRAERKPEVAPGLEPVEAISREVTTTATGEPTVAEPAPEAPGPITITAPARAGTRASEALAFREGGEIRIIADEVTNALLILATPEDYRMIQAALRKLDIVPLQVLIDAVIADVTLTNELRYGVQSFLQSGVSTAVLSTGTSAAIAATFPGFAYTYTSGDGDKKAILEALESVTDVNIVSSPRLLVLDNQSARLQVGDEVPIITQQQQSTADNANVINNIQFRETGVIVEVTPRVNSGGLVTLDINQEVSNVSQSVDTGVLTPTIAQRKLQSSIAVQSGQTIVLGGLIQENRILGRSGIPVLSGLPILGALFGTRDNRLVRSELIILLTPRVIRDSADAQAVTEELKRRVEELRPEPTVFVP
ncbi:MAG: type II secretion system secretin GspD [Alphaproteobacteria bacterium]